MFYSKAVLIHIRVSRRSRALYVTREMNIIPTIVYIQGWWVGKQKPYGSKMEKFDVVGRGSRCSQSTDKHLHHISTLSSYRDKNSLLYQPPS